jgi:biopolymer transport protein ExbD
MLRRLRREHEETQDNHDDLNLVPYMDIVTNVIIFLLAVAIVQKPVGVVNVSAPTIGPGGAARDLTLTVTLARDGIVLAAADAVEPTIPVLQDGAYDFRRLTDRLAAIKRQHPGETRATLDADADVPFDRLVRALDSMREDAGGAPLFPHVALAAGVRAL